MVLKSSGFFQMLGRFVGADTLLFGFASAESERIKEELPLKFLLTKV